MDSKRSKSTGTSFLPSFGASYDPGESLGEAESLGDRDGLQEALGALEREKLMRALPASMSERSVESVARNFVHSENARAAILEAGAFEKEGRAEIGPLAILKRILAPALTTRKSGRRVDLWLLSWMEENSVSRERLALWIGSPQQDSRGVFSLASFEVIRNACSIAKITVNRDRFDLRHLVMALLLSESGKNREIIDGSKEALGIDLREFIQPLVAEISKSPEPDENVDAWRGVLERRELFTVPFRAGTRVGLTAGDFTADKPHRFGSSGHQENKLVPDPLGILPDVRAFARLVALEQIRPPLSIGLFGPWGSGKSTFMDAMQDAIDTLSREAAKAKKPPGAPAGVPGKGDPEPLQFARQIVHVRFNAWQFADSNLWASLTSEFFRQLRAGGCSYLAEDTLKQLDTRIAARVGELSENASKADQEASKASAELGKAEKAAVAAEKQLNVILSEVDIEDLLKSARNFVETYKSEIRDFGRRDYRDSADIDLDRALQTAQAATSFRGKISIIAKAAGGSVPSALLVASGIGGAMAFGLVATLYQELHHSLFGWLQAGNLFGLATSIGAIAAGALPVWRKVEPYLAAAADFVEKKEKVAEANLKSLKDATTALDSARQKSANTRALAEVARADLLRYLDASGAAKPTQLLEYLLTDAPEIKAIDTSVGIVSNARRVFETLNTIALNKKKSPDQDAPDRIVLYIDDLDRCSYEQVYVVLQAIHLLLSFELFVVVVAVDLRWVEDAIAHEMRRHTGGAPVEANGVENRRRAIDYLEKIFQIPFWLRPLDAKASYGGYVDQLLANNRRPRELKADGGLGAQGGAGENRGPTEAAEQFDPQGPPLAKTTFEGFLGSDGEDNSLDTALNSVKLEEEEVAFLRHPALGHLCIKSPRAVKRMINVYRLIRARLEPADVYAFTGTALNPGYYRIIAILAAIEVGQPLEQAEALRSLFQAADRNTDLQEVQMFDLLSAIIAPQRAGYAGRQLLESVPEHARVNLALIAPLINECLSIETKIQPSIADFRTHATVVQRYSFNRFIL